MQKIPSSKKPERNPVLKYTGMAFQMIGVIVTLTLIGRYLDQYFENTFPIYTLVLVIFSVFAALFLTIRDLIK
jgi:hypothetical protein